jgi:hypothetical protein
MQLIIVLVEEFLFYPYVLALGYHNTHYRFVAGAGGVSDSDMSRNGASTTINFHSADWDTVQDVAKRKPIR